MAFAYNLSAIIDCARDLKCQILVRRDELVEVVDVAVFEQHRMHLALHRHDANNLTVIVDAVDRVDKGDVQLSGITVIEIGQHIVFPRKHMGALIVGHRHANHLTKIIKARTSGRCPAECPQIDNLPRSPQKCLVPCRAQHFIAIIDSIGVVLVWYHPGRDTLRIRARTDRPHRGFRTPVHRFSVAGNPAIVADPVCHAAQTVSGREWTHPAILPNIGSARSTQGARRPHDLATIVDRVGITDRAARKHSNIRKSTVTPEKAVPRLGHTGRQTMLDTQLANHGTDHLAIVVQCMRLDKGAANGVVQDRAFITWSGCTDGELNVNEYSQAKYCCQQGKSSDENFPNGFMWS